MAGRVSPVVVVMGVVGLLSACQAPAGGGSEVVLGSASASASASASGLVAGYQIVASGPRFEIDGGGPLHLYESGLVAGNDEEGNPFVWDPTGKVRHLSLLSDDLYSELHFSEVKGINSRGQAVGYSAREVLREDDLDVIKRAVLWEPDGSVRELEVPGEDDSEAVAINDRGQVIGTSGERAVLWEPDGSVRVLDSPAGAEWTSPSAINDRGQAVGQSGERAVLWEPDGTLRDLGDLPGAESSSAVAINDRGQVLLSSVYGDGSEGSSFLWDPVTGPQELGDRGGGISAVALNEKGQVAGTSVADGLRRAFVWDANTGMHELDVGGDLSVAVDINDLGQVVGWQANQYNPEGADPEFTGSAFLWDPDRGPINMAALWEGPSGAWAINNHGDVVGWRDSDFNDPQTIIVWSTAS